MDLATALTSRKTAKVMLDPEQAKETLIQNNQVLDDMLAVAGLAPFHHMAAREHLSDLSSPVPWRCYKLDRSDCVKLMKKLIESGDTTKVPSMLAAAEFLVQVTWLPDPAPTAGAEDIVFAGNVRNMEHIAAASAMVQSLLLCATQAGFRNYWSSGGPLRREEAFEHLGIPENEILLGSVFLFPANLEQATTKPGSMRDRRGELADWSRWVDIQ